MHERELQISFETALFMEEQLTSDITGNHEIYFDFAVSDDGEPFVAVAVSDPGGVAKLTRLFGDAIRFQEESTDIAVSVFIRELKPIQALN